MIALRKGDRALEKARHALAQPDPFDEIREQIDIVAYRMILRADELRTQMDPPEEAIRKQVVERRGSPGSSRRYQSPDDAAPRAAPPGHQRNAGAANPYWNIRSEPRPGRIR